MNFLRLGCLFAGLLCISAGAFAEELKWRASSGNATTPTPSPVSPMSFQDLPVPFRVSNRGAEAPAPLPTQEPPTSEPVLVRPTPVNQEPIKKNAKTPPAAQPELIKTMPMPQNANPEDTILEGDDPACDTCTTGCCRWPGSWCRGWLGRRFRCDGGCDCGWECCNERPTFWVSGEYLLYAFRKPAVPPLVGTSNFTDQPVTNPATGSTVIFDDDDWQNPWRSGARVRAGYWFRRSCCWGVDVGGFFTERLRGNFFASSSGLPNLTRPAIDVVTGAPNHELVAYPGRLAGSVNVDYSNLLWGVDGNLRRKLWCNQRTHIDLIGGARYISFDENVNIHENLTDLRAAFLGTGIVVHDNFRARNHFVGGQIGLDGEFHFWRRWFIGGTAKVALGVNNQIVNINGSQTITPPAPPAPLPAPAVVNSNFGVYALSTNSGEFYQANFTVVPEGNLKLGFELADNLRLWVGYDFLWMSSVVRAPDQIDTTINKALVPFNQVPAVANPAPAAPFRPAVLFRTTDFWAQGMNVGLEYKY